MLSDDVYRSKLQTVIATLRYWVPQISDTAHVEEKEHAGYWELSVTPHISGACSFALILHENQRYDFALGSETYEELPVEDLDMFLPLLEAIVDGQVVQRRWISQATGQLVDVDSIIKYGDGREWHNDRQAGAALTAKDRSALECQAKHFLPYRRKTDWR